MNAAPLFPRIQQRAPGPCGGGARFSSRGHRRFLSARAARFFFIVSAVQRHRACRPAHHRQHPAQPARPAAAPPRPPAAKSAEESQVRVRKRPDFVTGFTQKVQTGLGGMYLTVNEVDGKPFEIFATIGKSGHSVTAKAEAIGRLVSLAFRSGIDVADVVGQLKGIGGEHPIFQKKGLLLSIPDAIAWVLENRYLKGRNPVPTHTVSAFDRQLCPDCGGELVFQEGCHRCPNCAYTKCGG